MDRNLALEFVRVTEAAAIAAAKWIGKGDGKKADGAAVEAMRTRFNNIEFNGCIVIGEGKKDEAPELYVGEKLGTGNGPAMDIAVDPLECTDSVAFGRYNATTLVTTGPKGSLLSAPDTYMDKIAVGPAARDAISLEASVAENIQNVAKALGKNVEDVTVSMLDRPRHQQMINEIREAGARIRLITDGDVAVAVATCQEESPIDMLLGSGGSAEAVLAAVAMKIMGGQILARLKPRNDEDRKEMEVLGLDDKTIFTSEDLAKGDNLTFTATGVIDGPMLPGVIFNPTSILTHSVVMRSKSKTVRYLTTYHHEE
ncbi:fructose-bisphosphatase class II [Candidatus Roizmanbacteria bacterium CG_4_9_14_0_2_um_filter_39_13]|uniref:Fructose-1,6-bisphosphatase n=2 Tax=Candidatus Roizmaniibacteriota TaxID=1752723 RepID=A0A2M8F1B4_9BACT|nr:MAG: fructose-bisphosphatase class II [Candidatus Roizmanbacteria bacterium CG_4_10_14_0_2_um_filter_39_12]PJC33092.1 MAG: fructose-bisphosphatase class II [Candidatus Roizmanbacteria bacterium CG_4_9_14_0_2_um_filter_39_13]PJE62001.1 MAG: fructose-bisphosphatase class II [Candidatus Roizmanbacteria bacterium CG10_big_fil_rev_8_21_14_0_10_39_12]